MTDNSLAAVVRGLDDQVRTTTDEVVVNGE